MIDGVNAHLELSTPMAARHGLFRDVSGSLTQIFGRITSNGQVFISNQNGILFGASARVDVGLLFATTLSIKDHDFMAGRWQLLQRRQRRQGRQQGGIRKGVVEGHIVTANGYTALTGLQCATTASIVARAGNVTLAAGDRVTLDLIGDGLISLSIDQAAFNASVVNTADRSRWRHDSPRRPQRQRAARYRHQQQRHHPRQLAGRAQRRNHSRWRRSG